MRAARDRTVSRRSEPSSRTTLIGEQPNPLGPAPAPGCDEPTSRCQTLPSIWALGQYQPVIPGVPFIRWAMALPLRTTGSLWPTFVSARLVSLTVRQAYAIALYERFLTVLSLPSHASVTIWEATAPVKLPTIQCLDAGWRQSVRYQEKQKRYFTGDSTKADAFASMSPSYTKYVFPNTNVKLQ